MKEKTKTSKNTNRANVLLNVWMTPDQKSQIQRAANQRGISMAGLLKIATLEKINRENFIEVNL